MADLMLLEALAQAVIGTHGIAVAPTRIFETASWWFLESHRFDRVGPAGRVAVSSLAAVHHDPAEGWARAATELERDGRLDAYGARQLRWLEAFSLLMANPSRHAHHIAFFTGTRQLRLAPAYGHAPTLYAPTSDGQLPDRPFTRPAMTSDMIDVWDDAREAARMFWLEAADDARLSEEMKRTSATNARVVG